jgi:two-component system, NarL family, sensor histidine kinase UhpB
VTDTHNRYRRLVELSPDGIFIVQDDRLVLVNPAALRLVGATHPEQLLGTSPYDIFHPDGRGEIRQQIATLLTGGATPTVPLLEQKIVRLDGGLTDVEVAGTFLDDDQGRAVQLILRDITQRKQTEAALRQSEERLTLAFAGAQEGVWDWNLETGAVVYSPRWKQMLGYSDEEIEPHISAWEHLLHPDDMARAQQVNEGVVRGERTYEGEFRLRHKEGHYVHVLSRGYPVRREPGGPVVRIVGTHFDLTQRKQADAERARTELLTRLVFAQEDERRRIAREMHDQFGEQLTGLALRIATLKNACADRPELLAQVEALEKVARQLDHGVDQLVWELRPTALDDLGLRAALTNYVQDWSERVKISAELHTSGLLDDRLPSEVETTLYRIAQEALNNVAKHARARTVEIILERRADHVLLIIEDDGVGFETTEAPGSRQGFGLLGMQERAALVGATLQIESTGGGTTILLRMAMPQSQLQG